MTDTNPVVSAIWEAHCGDPNFRGVGLTMTHAIRIYLAEPDPNFVCDSAGMPVEIRIVGDILADEGEES